MERNVPAFYYTVIRGEIEATQYIKAALPCLLSDSNLGTSRTGDRYALFTTPRDLECIRATPEFSRLQSVLDTEVRLLGSAETDSGQQFIRECIETEAALIHLRPNDMWAAGSIPYLRGALDSGKKVVAQSRFEGNYILREFLREKCYDTASATISIPPRELVRAVLENPHSEVTTRMMHSPAFLNVAPFRFHWAVEGEGVLRHESLWDVSAIIYPRDCIPFSLEEGSMVLQELSTFGYTPEQVHWNDDSDQMFRVTLLPPLPIPRQAARDPASISQAALWLSSPLLEGAASMLQRPSRIHVGQLTSAWAATEELASKYIAQLVAFARYLQQDQLCYADLKVQLGMIDTLRAHEICWGEGVRRIDESLTSGLHSTTIQRLLAAAYAKQGDIGKSLDSIGRLIGRDIKRAAKEVTAIALDLQLAGYSALATQFIQQFERQVRSR